MQKLNKMEEAPLNSDVSECPINAKAFWVCSNDQIRLRIANWQPSGQSKGTIFLFQGRSENIEKYGRLACEFDRHGYSTLAIDWRGQGLSDRLTKDPMTGHVGQFSDYQKDVAAMLKAANELDLAKPWYLVGHSLGACIGLRALSTGFPASACVFTAPLWDINLSPFQRFAAWPVSWTAKMLGGGHKYAPGTRGESYVLNTAFEDNRLTHDPEMYDYYINVSKSLPDQQIGGPSMAWLFGALKETKSLRRLTSPNTPCLTFCGDQDEIVAISAIQNRMENWTNGKLEIVENAKHDVLCELPSIRENIIKKICNLFVEHV